MDTTDNEYSSVSVTDQGIEYWATRAFLSPQTCDALRRAAIVLVPHEGFREQVAAVFPNGTTGLFRVLKERSPAGLDVEIAIEESDYREVALHFDVVRLPIILLEWVVTPMIAAWLADYLKRKLGSRFEQAQVEASLIFERESSGERTTLRLDYKGPATVFEKTINGHIAKMVSGGQPDQAAGSDDSR